MAAERQVNVPLTLEDQAFLVPQLCDAALYGFRAQFQAVCEGLKLQLASALAKEAAEKAKSPPTKQGE